ncbi:MAG: hypothetical protein U0325_02570 [Polyangiales bacterium]
MSHRSSRVSLACALLASLGCGGGTPATPDGGTSGSTTRALRGTVPSTIADVAVSRVHVIDARTGREVAAATPNAQGGFAIEGLTRGKTYKVTLQAGDRAIPLVFATSLGAATKTNLFKVGTARDARSGALDGPIDVGTLTTNDVDGEAQATPTDPASAPNNQEDFDQDGMPDAVDSDDDGDGTPDAMDTDNDGDGMPDNQQFGDQDGDGVTNEADTDVDGDGMPDAMDPDNDNDGTPDAMDTSPNGESRGTTEDPDGDGIAGSAPADPSMMAPPMTAFRPAAMVRAGGYHTCALLMTGEVACWGRNNEGQLGVAPTLSGTPPMDNRGTAVVVPLNLGGARVVELALGVLHTCARLDNREVWCWGDNRKGQLGDGTTTSRATPQRWMGSGQVEQIAAGGHTTCARLSTGIRCWGDNENGQLGLGTRDNDPHPLPLMTASVIPIDAARVSVGADHACALRNGTVVCWGGNSYGQIGNARTRGAEETPVTLTNPTTSQQVSAGSFFTCARRMASPSVPELWCWGNDSLGQLGQGTMMMHRTEPDDVRTDPGVAEVQNGGSHACYRTNSGEVFCWGWNQWVQTGTGTMDAAQLRPTQVGGITGANELTVGYAHTCVRSSTNQVLCWGQNVHGQIGNGTPDTVAHGTPSVVMGL